MPYDPTGHLTKIRGQDYLQVKDRLVWLETDYTDYDIESALIYHENGRAVVQSTVSIYAPREDEDGTVRRFLIRSAQGIGSETIDSFEAYIEKAQTKSIGRALGMLGMGTQWAVEFNDADDNDPASLADSPVGPRQQQPPRQQQQSGGNGPANDMATNAQKSMIQYKAREAQLEPEALVDLIRQLTDRGFEELTKRDASKVIDHFNRRNAAPPQRGAPQQQGGGSDRPATTAQINKIKVDARNKGLKPEAIEQYVYESFGATTLEDLNTRQASQVIDLIQNGELPTP
jgi:hypothetical protein